MQENLVIVESPAKAKTIEKFLGKDFIVKSSFGHIRDLAKKDLGINIGEGYKPVYEIPGDKKKVVDELTKLAKSKTVWLASDEDREGEAIAWHLTEVLGLPVDRTKRIVFHEITKRAILEAIEQPRTVNMDLVNAQQARRILDRLVGFELSPVLWKKVRPSLSAGRVQSVAVRLIVEREREIIAFRSAAYFRVVAQFYAAGDPEKTLFKAELSSRFETEAQAETFLQSCIGATFTVAKAEEKPAQRYPAPPFTTSTLQQEAGRKLGMSVSQTMSVAQHLYEQGLITYMRTDSVNLSQQALAQCKEEITKLYGEKYSRWFNYKTKTKGAQEAHEAIRPSYIERQEIEGTPAEKKLYDLIWKRTVASQMVCAELDRTTITIDMSGSSNQFVAQGEVVRFDGFVDHVVAALQDLHLQLDVLLPDTGFQQVHVAGVDLGVEHVFGYTQGVGDVAGEAADVGHGFQEFVPDGAELADVRLLHGIRFPDDVVRRIDGVVQEVIIIPQLQVLRVGEFQQVRNVRGSRGIVDQGAVPGQVGHVVGVGEPVGQDVRAGCRVDGMTVF